MQFRRDLQRVGGKAIEAQENRLRDERPGSEGNKQRSHVLRRKKAPLADEGAQGERYRDRQCDRGLSLIEAHERAAKTPTVPPITIARIETTAITMSSSEG